jgi:acyl-CoA synthetase (NDP forming)
MPETAVEALASLCRVTNLNRINQPARHQEGNDSKSAKKIIQQAASEGQTSLSFAQGAKLLSAYDIPVCPFAYVQNRKQAEKFAKKFGYPLVAKIDSPGLFHRFEHGAVITGINNTDELLNSIESLGRVINKEGLSDAKILLQPMIEGLELIIGVNRDPLFGPVVMFGMGGTFVEALKDVSFGVAPLSMEYAQHMIHSIRAFALLEGFRGSPAVDIANLGRILQRLGQLSLDIPEIKEIDINPFIAGKDLQAVDILIRL